MEGLWNFSPNSEVYLQKFLASVRNGNAESEWVNFFGNSAKDYKSGTNEDDGVGTTVLLQQEKVQHVIDVEDVQHYIEVIENDLELRFDDIVNECIKDPSLLSIFADKFEQSTMEKFLHHSLHVPELSNVFVCGLFLNMFPAVLNKFSAVNVLQLLFKAHSKYPRTFCRALLPIIIRSDVSGDIFLNFAKKITDTEKCEVMCSLRELDLTPEQIVKHLQTILDLYKLSDKSFTVHSYVLNCLIKTGDLCGHDKTYGLCLLNLIRYMHNVSERAILQGMVDNHHSVFKKSCNIALKNSTIDKVNLAD